MATAEQGTPTPYRDAAHTYRAAGWLGVIPVPYRTKRIRAEGWTGHSGAWPSGADVQAWVDSDARDEGGGNIVLRVPPDVIGVDVDAYAGKTGGQTVTDHEQRWGPLPPTWTSTARDDGVSGIRFYRVPEGLRWPGQAGPHVEIIQTAHRYAVVWPSVHPDTGGRYRWCRPDGLASTAPPRPDELPELPDAWLVGLTGGELAEHVDAADLTHGQARDWLVAHSRPDPCRAMRTVRDRLLDEMRSGSAHESLRRLLGLVRLAEQGHRGLVEAIGAARDAFIAESTNPARTGAHRNVDEAEAEWRRSLAGAVNRVVGNPSVGDEQPDDPCDQPFAGLVAAPSEHQLADALRTAATDPFDVPAGDTGDPNRDPQQADDSATDGQAGEHTSWWPRELQPVLDGENAEPGPDVLARTDDQHLFYRGKVNGLLGESESGKAQPYSAPVATLNGWTTMGELVVGSTILDSDGLPQTVTAVHERGERDVWEVVTGQGVVVEACAEHLWAVTDANDRSRNRPPRVLTTEQVHATQRLGSGAPRWQLPMPAPARYAEPGCDLPVDPYLLGLLLGDGGLTAHVTFTNPDAELHDALAAALPYGCTTHEYSNASCRTVSVIATRKGQRNPLLDTLRREGLHGVKSIGKFVPRAYQRAAVGERLALLQGLMDTDGGIENRGAVFSTSSPRLADDVCELVRGLGGTATPHWRRPSYPGGVAAPACRITVALPLGTAPFRLARQRERYDSHVTRREPVNRIAEVRRTNRTEPMRCIAVSSPDRLYRTTGHTLTHNTWVALLAVAQALEAGLHVLYLDFEDSAAGIIGRLIAMGVDRQAILERFTYVDPDEDLHALAAADLAELLAGQGRAVIVIDGVNAAMSLLGLDINDNGDATRFSQKLLRPLARTGAAVITIDHVGKNKDTRGKGGIGAQAKRAMVTGCALSVEVSSPFGRGQTGRLRLTVDKDRGGHVRGAAENGKFVGCAVMKSNETGDAVTVSVEPPSDSRASSDAEKFRPTGVMGMVSQFLSTTDGEVSGKQIETGVAARASVVRAAVDRLVEDGYVARHTGPRNAILHRQVRRYSELSELVDGGDDDA